MPGLEGVRLGLIENLPVPEGFRLGLEGDFDRAEKVLGRFREFLVIWGILIF